MNIPNLYLQEHDPQADRQGLRQLAVRCQQFSPIVGLEAAAEPDCLFLDVTGLGSLHGGEQNLAHDVDQAFGRRGYTVRAAIADTLGAAWAVAHFVTRHGECSIIAPGGNFDVLCPLPVEALRLPDRTVQRLKQVGVSTVGQLATLPRASLSSRFDRSLLQRWDQATGAVQEMVVAYRPPPPLEVQWTLEHPTMRREVVEQVLVCLVERLAKQLVQQNQEALELLCQLDCADSRTARIEVGLFRATANVEHLRQLIHMQLERLVLPGPLHHIGIRAVTTVARQEHQHQLLGDDARDVPRELAGLIDHLSSRLGRDHVVGACRQADAQVEYAYRDVPLTGRRWKGSRNPGPVKPRAIFRPGQRPLWLPVPPLPVEVIAVAPEGPPVSFVYQRRQHRVVRHWGPERIETGWWRGPSVRRDYYRVEDQQGNRFWLFRRRSDQKWFLGGIFE